MTTAPGGGGKIPGAEPSQAVRRIPPPREIPPPASRWKTPTPPHALALLFVSALLAVAGFALWPRGPLWWPAGAIPTIAFALPVLLWAAASGNPGVFLPSRSLTVRSLATGLTLLLGGSLSGLAASGILSRLPSASGEENALLNLVRGVTPLQQLLFFVLVPAFCEEILFRGGVLASLRRWPPATACIASGASFALFHGSLVRFLPVAILGTALAVVVVRTGNLWLAVFGHALHNGMVLLMVNASSGAGNEAVGWTVIAALAVPGIVLFVSGCLMNAGKDVGRCRTGNGLTK